MISLCDCCLGLFSQGRKQKFARSSAFAIFPGGAHVTEELRAISFSFTFSYFFFTFQLMFSNSFLSLQFLYISQPLLPPVNITNVKQLF